MKLKTLFCFIIQLFLFSNVQTHKLKGSDLKQLDRSTINIKINKTEQNTIDPLIIPVKIKEGILIYLQFFILFTILSLHRLNEEMFKVISIYIDNKYSNFINLNKLKPGDYDGSYVYLSGSIDVLYPACDDMFAIQADIFKPIKLERIVEILKPGFRKWKKLLDEEYFIKGENLCYSFCERLFTFPKIAPEMFYGEVELKGVRLSQQQLKQLNNSKFVKINSAVYNDGLNIKDYEYLFKLL
jgi:hypothetical protein